MNVRELIQSLREKVSPQEARMRAVAMSSAERAEGRPRGWYAKRKRRMRIAKLSRRANRRKQ